MALWDFLEKLLFPLFGEIPPEAINMGWLGTFTITQLLQLLFWLVVGGSAIHFLCYLPYRWILSLMQVKKWKGK